MERPACRGPRSPRGWGCERPAGRYIEGSRCDDDRGVRHCHRHRPAKSSLVQCAGVGRFLRSWTCKPDAAIVVPHPGVVVLARRACKTRAGRSVRCVFARSPQRRCLPPGRSFRGTELGSSSQRLSSLGFDMFAVWASSDGLRLWGSNGSSQLRTLPLAHIWPWCGVGALPVHMLASCRPWGLF